MAAVRTAAKLIRFSPDELARITNGYSPSMIEQCCSIIDGE